MSIHLGVVEGWLTWPFEALSLPSVAPRLLTGGKVGAPTFLTDNTFNIAISAILKKDRQKIQLTVEFDKDCMAGFCIQQPVSSLFYSIYLVAHIGR